MWLQLRAVRIYQRLLILINCAHSCGGFGKDSLLPSPPTSWTAERHGRGHTDVVDRVLARLQALAKCGLSF
ncbi:hypothetical protein BV25DRAFT_1820680 [Artomyces pyxidatus]|uniref:Uncharacterized protein n=1 Tax=Artomyces pyxidatus TaxID=48021 RepID=A0ACB8TDZ6_9AGAM|nr:hypothetical protein BV25DRAFT_1820680 [Artomyces pyxidatus]